MCASLRARGDPPRRPAFYQRGGGAVTASSRRAAEEALGASGAVEGKQARYAYCAVTPSPGFLGSVLELLSPPPGRAIIEGTGEGVLVPSTGRDDGEATP